MNTSDFVHIDPAEIERLANEYFKQSIDPNFSFEPNVLDVNQLQLSGSGLGAPSSVPALPVNAAPQSYTSLPPSPPPAVLSAGSAPAVIPAASVPLAGFDRIPVDSGFSFLQYARPLDPTSFVSGIPGQEIAIRAVQGLQEPSPTDVSSVQPQAKSQSLPSYSTSDLTGPTQIGAPTRAPGFDDLVNYSFVRDVRPLLSYEGVPKLEPNDYVPDATSLISSASTPFDINAVRRDFPILEERINGRQLVWLDNAATTQKPRAVIDRISYYYLHENSNIHRAAHTLAARSTDAYEGARDKVARFLKASSPKEIIFVRGATEGINLIAQTWGKKNIQKDDEIVITWLEHHANIVPWQMLCSEKGARLRVAPVDSDGQVIVEEYQKLLGPKTKLVSIAQVSNALGTVLPVTEMTAAAHRVGATVVIDGAQAVSHMPIDVQAYGCDFYVFSGHKVFAPTGIGVVYGKLDVLEQTPPWQGGGNMIVDVTFEKTTFHSAPGRFEAGTGSIAPAVGLGAAIDYIEGLGMHNVARYEHDLLVYAVEALSAVPGLHLIGTAKEKASVLSFVLDGFRTEEVGTALNQEGIAVRSGHHCAQPILRRFGLESTVRPSLALYNTCEEVDKLVAILWKLKQGRLSSVV